MRSAVCRRRAAAFHAVVSGVRRYKGLRHLTEPGFRPAAYPPPSRCAQVSSNSKRLSNRQRYLHNALHHTYSAVHKDGRSV